MDSYSSTTSADFKERRCEHRDRNGGGEKKKCGEHSRFSFARSAARLRYKVRAAKSKKNSEKYYMYSRQFSLGDSHVDVTCEAAVLMSAPQRIVVDVFLNGAAGGLELELKDVYVPFKSDDVMYIATCVGMCFGLGISSFFTQEDQLLSLTCAWLNPTGSHMRRLMGVLRSLNMCMYPDSFARLHKYAPLRLLSHQLETQSYCGWCGNVELSSAGAALRHSSLAACFGEFCKVDVKIEEVD